MKKQNSLISWMGSKGYTVFVVSWVNPDESYSEIGMDDYITDGYLQVIQVVKSITARQQINAIGYCIGGTALGLTLAYLNKTQDSSVRAATFFTTLTDFAQQGEFSPFLQNDFIDAIEEEVSKSGILKSFIMARTFSFLRSTDLIYSPAIKSYMMGQTPTMTGLNDRERDILTQRRLVDEVKTLEELSEIYSVSRERVRQIEVRAFEKLQEKMREMALEKNMISS